MHEGGSRWCTLLIVILLYVHASLRSAAVQEPAQMREGIITTFAPIVQKVAPSVVTVFTTQTVSRGMTTFPFGDDALRQFFGGQLPMQGKQTLQGLGSGVIVSPDGYILTANQSTRSFQRSAGDVFGFTRQPLQSGRDLAKYVFYAQSEFPQRDHNFPGRVWALSQWRLDRSDRS